MLYVKELQINEGLHLKRVWTRGRGRADRLQKRTATSPWCWTKSGAREEKANGTESQSIPACGWASTRAGCPSGSWIPGNTPTRCTRTSPAEGDPAAQETQGADIADLEIIRHPQRITLIIHTGRPGVIIGAKGANIEKLGKHLQKLVGKKIQIKIKEIRRPETDAQLSPRTCPGS